MLTVLLWWLWVQVIGLVTLPLAHQFFRRLPDRGYMFARPLGLLLVSYSLWIGCSLGLLRNTTGGAVFSILVVASVSFLVYRRGRAAHDPGLLAWLRANVRLVLAGEILFAVALALWSLIRAYSPELTTAGGEKFMEIMYLNSIGRAEHFPPQDAWLSGYAISYYYFGYVIIATLTRLSGLAAHLTFNVGVALLFALTCTGAFGLVYNLVRSAADRTTPPPDPSLDTEPARGSSGRRASPISYGLLGALVVAVMGNLEGFLEVLYSARLLPDGFWRWLDILDINQAPSLSTSASLMPSRSGWWWGRASRVVHDLDPLGSSMGVQPIDEFPGFSFLLGDMHPHVLALPFVLLALAVALRALFVESESRQPSGIQETWLTPIKRLSLLVPLCLGALGFLNTWDFPIYLLVFMAAYGIGRWRLKGQMDWALWRDVGLMGGIVAALGVIFYLPFYIGFQSQAGGVLPTLYVGTRFRQYFVMFGPFLVVISGLLVVLVRRTKKAVSGWRLFRSWAVWTATLVFAPLAVMLLIVLAMLVTPGGRDFLEGIRRVSYVYEIVGDDPWLSVVWQMLLVKLRTWVMPLVVAGMAALAIVLLWQSVRLSVRSASLREAPGKMSGPEPGNLRGYASQTAREFGSLPAPGWRGTRNERTEMRHGVRSSPSLQFVLLCVIVALVLTLSVEFIYLVDVFRVRMNTIFKFYFQAWVLLGVASAFTVYWLSRRRTWLRFAFWFSFWLLFAMAMVYPVLANFSRAGGFRHPPNLDGTAYLADSQPEDYAAVAWLNEHVQGTPIILETPGSGGNSYVYEGRISALTGLPTLLGWGGHETQWRGDSTVQDRRDPDIKTIYNTLDQWEARALLEEYNITYVYVGPLERRTFDPRALAKFAHFMDVAYQAGEVTIYKRTTGTP